MDGLVLVYVCDLLSVKSDLWVRQLCECTKVVWKVAV